MEQNVKYYTPDISEFHFGFIYEERDLDLNLQTYGWERRIWDGDYNLNLVIELGIEEFRVKYLDEQDLFDLGFEKSVVHGYLHNEYNMSISQIGEPVDGSTRIIIYCDNTHAELYLKNKSELERVMKQLVG